MKKLDKILEYLDKKTLIFASVGFLILTVFFSSIYVSNVIENNKINTSILSIKSKINNSDVNGLKTEDYKRKISEYNNKINKIENSYSEEKANLKQLVDSFCDCMSYEVQGDGNDKSITELKNALLPYVTEDCLKNYIEKQYHFTDKPLYYIERKPSKYLYKDIDTAAPSLFTVIQHNGNLYGYEYTTFHFKYDKDNKSYKISRIDVIKEQEN